MLLAGTAAILFTLAGGGSALAAGAHVSAVDFRFSPQTVTIGVGDSVSWSNDGQSPHTVTGSGFDSGNLNPGQGYSHTFSSAGTFAYHCQYHQGQGMVGTVVVLAGGGGGGGGSGGTPLPNTGIGSGALTLGLVGAGLLLVGGFVLLSARRRRA